MDDLINRLTDKAKGIKVTVSSNSGDSTVYTYDKQSIQNYTKMVIIECLKNVDDTTKQTIKKQLNIGDL